LFVLARADLFPESFFFLLPVLSEGGAEEAAEFFKDLLLSGRQEKANTSLRYEGVIKCLISSPYRTFFWGWVVGRCWLIRCHPVIAG
jgi:hypothetical protein